MKTAILLILIFPALVVKGQHGSVKGTLADSATLEPVYQATVSVLRESDKGLAGYTVTNKKGEFDIPKINDGNYLLLISNTGFVTRSFLISVKSGPAKTVFEKVLLQRDYKTLTEATVTDYTPVRVKDDTVSFKADAFKTSAGATLEDVMKKIPGIQVQKDGSIRAMGENVQKLYVDGKEFFANDPAIATKNLTADMVDQVQVFDDMSEQARFTKIDDGSRSKSINIKLKKDKKKGDFGKLSAGAGSGNRYDHSASWNHFNDLQKISLIGSAGNTNKQSFSMGNSTSGNQFSNGPANGSQGRQPGANGTNSSAIAGINYSDQWSSRMDFRGSYLYNDNTNRQEQAIYKAYSYPGDSASATKASEYTTNKNKSHRVSARWEYQADSFNTILYTGNFSVQEGSLEFRDSSFTLAAGKDPFIAIMGNSFKEDGKANLTYNGEWIYRRRFRIPGRTFTIGWKNSAGTNTTENDFQALVHHYDHDGKLITLINPDQQGEQQNDSRSNSLSASYTNPAGKNQLFEINYAYNTTRYFADKKTFDYNPASGKYDQLNLQQTNYFDNTNQSNRAGINFRALKQNFNYQLGTAVQFSETRSRSRLAQTGKDSTTRQRFTNFFPTASFNYKFSRNSNIRFYYRGRTNMPSINQLQDVNDISNPLFIRTGNPGLKQEFNNNFNLNYNHFNTHSQAFINTSLNLSATSNKIVNSLDSAGAVTIVIRPENINGIFNASGIFSIGWPLKHLKGASISINSMGFYSKDASLVFKQKYFTTLLTLDHGIGFNYTKEKFELGLTGGMIYNKIHYDVQPGSGHSYIKMLWSADLLYRFKKEFYVFSRFEQSSHAGRTPGYNTEISLWNMSVAKKFMKNQVAEIKLTAYDILKQDKGINRMATDNYLEDSRYMVTPRFFILAFTYNFRHSPGRKSETPSRPAPMQFFSN